MYLNFTERKSSFSTLLQIFSQSLTTSKLRLNNANSSKDYIDEGVQISALAFRKIGHIYVH